MILPEITITVPGSAGGSPAADACLLLSGVDPSKTCSISKMLELSLKWDRDEASLSTLSPLRSPIVADWKAVGSPIAAPNGASNPLFDDDPAGQTELLQSAREDAATIERSLEDQVKIKDIGQPQHHLPTGRRQRAMSLIERTVFTPRKSISDSFELDLDRLRKVTHSASQSGTALQFERQRPAGPSCATEGEPDRVFAQVPQLPASLHDDLGVGSVAEVTEIFKRSSMDSLTTRKSQDSPATSGKPLSCMPSLFGRMPFGPAAMVFGGSDESPASGGGNTVPRGGVDRSSGLLPSSDSSIEPLGERQGGGAASVRVDFTQEHHCGGKGKPAPMEARVGEARRHPRRHSIATPSLFPPFEIIGSQVPSSLAFLSRGVPDGLGSSLSPSAAAFHFKGYSENSSPILVDYMAVASGRATEHSHSLYMDRQVDGAAASASPSSPYAPMSAASLREAAFQLSSYKGPLYAVEFKAGRTEIFYVLEIDSTPQLTVKVGDLVIVEADRGEDLGKVTIEISVEKLKQLMMPGSSPKAMGNDKDSDIITPELAALVHSKEIVPKRIHRLAQPGDLKLLQAKAQEEAIAMVRCQSRIRQKKLPMEVVDAEYQWDRNKLTFYFCADRRIDFRELVRDLFRIYKTRIWMCAVDKGSSRMLMYSSPCGSSVTSISAGGLMTSKGDHLDSESLSFYSSSYCTSPI